MESVLDRMKRENTQAKIDSFNAKMKETYEFKRRYAEIRAREFVRECDIRDLNYHVSVGGLDSIVLFVFLRSLGIKAEGVSVSSLENPSNRNYYVCCYHCSVFSSLSQNKCNKEKSSDNY